ELLADRSVYKPIDTPNKNVGQPNLKDPTQACQSRTNIKTKPTENEIRWTSNSTVGRNYKNTKFHYIQLYPSLERQHTTYQEKFDDYLPEELPSTRWL
ncbi:unnamed protein product, partial [Schistosoma turkestanicum]